MNDETIKRGYTATPMPPHPRKGQGGPYDPDDRKLSVAHKIDRVRFNIRHGQEHMKKAAMVERELHEKGVCSGIGDCQKGRGNPNVRHANPKD